VKLAQGTGSDHLDIVIAGPVCGTADTDIWNTW